MQEYLAADDDFMYHQAGRENTEDSGLGQTFFIVSTG